MEQDNNKNINHETIISTKHYSYVCKNFNEFKEIQNRQAVFDLMGMIFFLCIAFTAIFLIIKIVETKN